MPTNHKTSSEFDQFAPSYTELLKDPIKTNFTNDPLHFHRRKWLVLQAYLKSAGVDPHELRWLDAGCGRGELLSLIGTHFKHATGCDPSIGMLPSHTSFRVHKQPSPTELPFDDARFDLVTVACVFHHVAPEARVQLARDIRRVLAPGGLACVIEHNPRNPVTRAIVRRCPIDVDAQLLTARAAFKLLHAAGFKSCEAKYFLYLPERIFNQLGSLERPLCRVPLGGQYAVIAQVPGFRAAE